MDDTEAVYLSPDSPERKQLKAYECPLFLIPTRLDQFGLVDMENNRLEIYRFSDFTQERVIGLPGKPIFTTINPEDSLFTLVIQENDQYFVYLMDFETGHILLKMDLAQHPNWWGPSPAKMYYFDGWLYASSGYKMDIKNLMP